MTTAQRITELEFEGKIKGMDVLFSHEFPDGSSMELWPGNGADRRGFIAIYPAYSNDVGYEIFEEYSNFYDAVVAWQEYIERGKKDHAVWKVMVEFRVSGPSESSVAEEMDVFIEALLDRRSAGLPDGFLLSANAEKIEEES